MEEKLKQIIRKLIAHRDVQDLKTEYGEGKYQAYDMAIAVVACELDKMGVKRIEAV